MTTDPHALDLPPRDDTPPEPDWPGWQGIRRGPDHTSHWTNGAATDRELTRERGLQ